MFPISDSIQDVWNSEQLIRDMEENQSNGEKRCIDNDNDDDYEDGEEDNLTSKFHHIRSFPYSLWWLGGLMSTGILLISMISVWKIATPSPTNLHEEVLTDDGKSFPSGRLTWSQQFKPLPCGKSPAEALARGCHFDIVATAWLPTKCIDQELIAEFQALHSWQYFSDHNATHQYSNDSDELGSKTGLIWTTHRWHAAHCLFMWKKLNRALVNGWLTDGETIKQRHTDHCSKTILHMKDPEVIGSIVEIIYPPC